jgi:hypothetical protein
MPTRNLQKAGLAACNLDGWTLLIYPHALELTALNNNYTYASDSQSLVLRHTSQLVLNTRDMYKSNHTYYRRTFLSSLLKSFLRILLKIWRGITRDPKYKAISDVQICTDRQEIPVQ